MTSISNLQFGQMIVSDMVHQGKFVLWIVQLPALKVAEWSRHVANRRLGRVYVYRSAAWCDL